MLYDLVEEYEAFYRDDPERWTADNNTLCRTVSRYKPGPVRVLDVGCGNGHTLAAMQAVFPGAQLYGIDLSQAALRMAADKVPGGVFKQVFIEQYQPGVRFDVITVVGVAEHFIDPAEGLTCVARLLAEGGICYIELPHNLAYSPGTHSYRRLGSGSGQMEWHLERAEWEQLIGEAGFVVLEALQGDSVVNEFVWVLKTLKKPMSEYQNMYAGRPAAVLGGGPSLPEDMRRLPANCLLITVNYHAMRICKPLFMVYNDAPSNDPEMEQAVKAHQVTLVSPEPTSDVVFDMPVWTGFYSSNTAAWFAGWLGCDPVILCGMDLYQGEQTYFHPTNRDAPTFHYPLENHIRPWIEDGRNLIPHVERVRAMSGPLVNVFGAYA